MSEQTSFDWQRLEHYVNDGDQWRISAGAKIVSIESRTEKLEEEVQLLRQSTQHNGKQLDEIVTLAKGSFLTLRLLFGAVVTLATLAIGAYSAGLIK